MVKIWLCLITARNWRITKERGIYGVWGKWRKRLHQQVRKGDILVFYLVPGKKQIIGMAKVSSEPFDDFETEIWPNQRYPHRVRIEVSKDLSTNPLSIYDVMNEMLLFEGKPLGPTLFGKSIIPLSEHDFKAILKALRVHQD